MSLSRTPLPLLTVELRSEQDVVLARQRARQVASLLGFGALDQARLATCTSEMTRNAVRYAGAGRCEFHLDDGALVVRVSDRGPGIRNLNEILGGRYHSATGMGLGIAGTRRLMDRFEIESAPSEGTTVVFARKLPEAAPPPAPSRLAQELSRMAPAATEEEIAVADRELLRAVSELRARNEELEQLRSELEETNRGVVALYAELDEKAESLRKATELKSRFLSNMSHEFRTPLNSITSLARILLDGSEGPLAEGQHRAVSLIRKAAVDLADMVNDLLDLAKIEAGKIVVRPAEVDLHKLFGSLRGVIKPLVPDGGPVALVFEEPDAHVPPFSTDEGKVQQILRNLASNALKFTERGEVRIGARVDEGGITFFVRDSGIGIAPEDQQRIFEEFVQVESHAQKRIKGTGLGLPLSRKLAELLGGELSVESEPGSGSTFSLRLPWNHEPVATSPRPAARTVLAAVDDEAAVLRWERFLEGTSYRLVAVHSIEAARALVQREQPAVVLAGMFLGGVPTRALLAELKKTPALRDIAVVGVSTAEHEARALSLAADVVAGGLVERHELLETLARALSPPRRVLVIARDREPRDELRSQLAEPRLELLEARDAAEGLRRAREERPRAIVLDAGVPAFVTETAAMLRSDPDTRQIPLLVRVSRTLRSEEAAALSTASAQLVPVQTLLRDEAAKRLREAVWKAGGANG